MTTSQPAQKSTGRTILIIVAVIVGLCILIPICVIVILALMGPAIGNTFSNIIQNMPTPTP